MHSTAGKRLGWNSREHGDASSGVRVFGRKDKLHCLLSGQGVSIAALFVLSQAGEQTQLHIHNLDKKCIIPDSIFMCPMPKWLDYILISCLSFKKSPANWTTEPCLNLQVWKQAINNYIRNRKQLASNCLTIPHLFLITQTVLPKVLALQHSHWVPENSP